MCYSMKVPIRFSSVGGVQGSSTGGRLFDAPFGPRIFFPPMKILESSQRLGKYIVETEILCGVMVKRTPRAYISTLTA